MAVQVWIGEKPEHPSERKAIIGLANGLDRLEGLYVMLANFSVGGHTIDLVIIKHDAIFIIEMKHCDGRVFGSVNGRWKVVSASGSVKWLNQGRKNPYNQAIAYYYAFRNFLHDNRLEFLSEQKATQVDFRSIKRLIVIAPTLEEGSDVALDWRVAVKGLDELPTYLVTERTDEINLTQSEMLAIPRLLHCSPWQEVNNLVAGVMPAWSETPSEPPPPPEPEPEPLVQPEPSPPPTLKQRLRASPRTVLAALNVLATALVLILVLARSAVVVTQTAPTAIIAVAPPATLPPSSWSGTATSGCVSTQAKPPVRKQRNPVDYRWYTIEQTDAEPPYVAVALDRVAFCPDRIVLYWSVQNRTTGIVQMGLNGRNLRVQDTTGIQYPLHEEQAVIRVRQEQTGTGEIEIPRPISPNATTLNIEILNEPFGMQLFTVQVPADLLISDR